MNKDNNERLRAALIEAAKDHPTIQGNYTKLAAEAKMHQPTVFRILSGENPDPRISSILKIAEACGIKPWEFIADAQARQTIKDEKLLATIMDDIDEVFGEKSIHLATIKKAKLVAIIYNRHINQAVRPKHFKAEVIELFNLVA
jgi:DNA-binding phage protein